MNGEDLTGFSEPEDKNKEGKMDTKGLTRREFLRDAALAGVGLVAAACAPTPSPTPAPPTAPPPPTPTAAPAAVPTATPTVAPTPIPIPAVPAKDKIVVGISPAHWL